MPITFCIGNQKGGVGKTTTAVNLSDAIGRAGKKVLVIDADPQGNTTSTILKDIGQRESFSIVKALESPIEEGNLSSMACITNNDNVDIIPNTLSCLEWERRASNTPDSVLGFRRLLSNDTEINKYDFIIIDAPPNLGNMLNNALMITDYVIVPIPVSDQYAIDGFASFLSLLQTIRGQNRNLTLLGVLLTQLDARTPTDTKNVEKIKSYFKPKGVRVFKSIIRVNIDLKKATSARKTIFDYNIKKTGAEDYNALAEEILSTEAIKSGL